MNIEELAVSEDLLIRDFMIPISESNPGGSSLKETSIYADIQEARAFDDPTLPRGVWDHDLKRSDWNRVSELCQSSLLEKTKDIQIAIWFLESQLNLRGLSSLPVNLLLLAQLTRNFWNDIYPLMLDGEADYRTNLFDWLSEKIVVPIRKVTIAHTLSGESISWLDWEKALQSEGDEVHGSGLGGKSLSSIKQAIDQTSVEYYLDFCQDLSDSLAALDYLRSVLTEQLAEEAPSLATLKDLLTLMLDTITGLTGGRSSIAQEEQEQTQRVSNEVVEGESFLTESSVINNRQKAYAMLAESAEFLLRDDPHSPVPYLVYKAIEWGHLSTSELYAEIFIKHDGRLNIFDILGIEEGRGR